MRGASQGLLESGWPPERDSRSGTDPRLAALQQVRQSASIRESGLGCARGGRQQAPTNYPSQTPATDTSHMLDMKEKSDYQRRMFSQPPGYIAPPPYESPHKGSPVLHHCDTSWEQKGKRQTNWSQPKLRNQGVSADLCDHKKGEKEEFTKPDGNRKGFLSLERLTHRRQETDALQGSIPFSIQEKHIEREGVLYEQQPQVLQTVENKKINEELSPKVIEGREFRKSGGMTIFCLVSRIADTTETPSLPPSTLQTNTVLGGFTICLRGSSGFNQSHKLADEVDFRAPTLTEPQNASHGRNVKAKEKETTTCIESEMFKVNLSETAETDIVSPEKVNTSNADSTTRMVAQPVHAVAVKYPLWREPSITSRAETESLKANSEEGESDVLQDQEIKNHSIEVEVRRLDIKPDTESKDNMGLLVINTTCVVVKMELIPSLKKEHVHYLHTKHSQLDTQTTVSPECVQSNSLNQEETTDQNTETDPQRIHEKPETKLDSDLMEKKAHEGQSEISSCCMSSSPVSKREMLEERAERILGIHLHDCIAKQQPEDAASLLDWEVEPAPIKDNDIEDAFEQMQEDTSNEEQLQSQVEVGQTENAVCLQENDETKDHAANEGGGDVAVHQDHVSNMSEEKDIVSQLKTDIKTSPELEINEHPLLKPASEEGSTEQEENDTSSHHSQCLSPPTNLSDSSSLSPSLALCGWPSGSDRTPLLHISESNKEESPDTELIALNSAENVAPHLETSSLPHTPPLLHSGSTPSTLHTDQSPRHSSLDFIVVEDHDEEGETSHVINNEISEAFAKDMTEERVSGASGQPDNAACVKKNNVTDEQHTKEADKDPIDHTMEKTLNIEDAKEVDILQQQYECVQAEEVACVKESYVMVEQGPKEDKEDPSDFLEQTISQEKVSDTQTQTGVNNLQQQYDNEEETFMTEKQSKKGADEDQQLSTEDATDTQTQRDKDILQDIEPQTELSHSSPPSSSESDCEVFQSPLDVLSPCDLSFPPHTSNESEAEFVSLLPSASPAALNPEADPAAGIHETDPFFIYLDSCEESFQFPSSSCTDSPPVLPSSSSTPPPQEEGGDVDPELDLKEEPQYPMALWDAVNRIRKHTAPDSENEEEEVSELWDPESVGEGMRCLGVVAGMDSEKIVFDGAGQRAVSTEESVEDDEFGQIQEDSCDEEPGGHTEEDTLSCSSTSSHGSGDTIIVADEGEVEETQPGQKSMAGNDEEFQTEGERCCDAEVKDETAGEGDSDGDESVTHVSSQREDCQVEATNKTRAAKMAETEREENEQVDFMPSAVSETLIESESTG